MTELDPVRRVAENVATVLTHSAEPLSLGAVRRRVASRDKHLFADACALAIRRRWVKRIDSDTIAVGDVPVQKTRSPGRGVDLARELDEALGRQA